MTEKSNPQELSLSRLQRSESTLKAGQLLLTQALYADATNRFYYSMLYGVMALLTAKKMDTSSHEGSISLFDSEFVQPGDFTKEMSVWLNQAFEYRIEADYAEWPIATMEKAIELEIKAEAFVQSIKGYFQGR